MNSTCPSERFGEFVWEKTLYNFYSFQTLSKKHSHFPKKFPAGLSKLLSMSPEDCFEVLFWEIHMLLFHFRTRSKETNPHLRENFRFDCWNGTSPEEHLWKFFEKRYISFHHFWKMSEELSTFWQEMFGRLVKNAIWVSRGTFWEETNFFERNICSFWSFLEIELLF